MAPRVLILEDDLDYRRLLKDLYKKILETGNNDDVLAVDDPEAALTCLRTGKYGLLSLDINLSESVRADAQGAYPEYVDGSRVLETAVSEGLNFGCIVFTGAPMDRDLDQVIADDGHRVVIQMALGEFLEENLEGQHCHFLKRPGDTFEEKKKNVDRLGQWLNKKKLLRLLVPNKKTTVQLAFVGGHENPTGAIITERVNNSIKCIVELTRSKDVLFFWSLHEAYKHGRHGSQPVYLTNRQIVTIFMEKEGGDSLEEPELTKKAQMFARSVKRKFDDRGFSEKAWKLLVETVPLKGRRLVKGAKKESGSIGRGKGGYSGKNVAGTVTSTSGDNATYELESDPATKRAIKVLGLELSKLWTLIRNNEGNLADVAELWHKNEDQTKTEIQTIQKVFDDCGVKPWPDERTSSLGF